MFKRTSETNIEISVRPPLIYLDHCAVREISSKPEWRAHLRETFHTRGTLMFSVVNMLEMARNSGSSYSNIRDLLNDLGPYWLPSDPDPNVALLREMQGDVPPKSFFVSLDIFGPIFREMPNGTFSLGTALEKLQDVEFRARAPDILVRPGFLKMLHEFRSRHLAGEKFLPLNAPPHSLPWIENSLVRLLVSDGKKIKSNDVVDLFHAIVSLRYATVLVLDKAWASFAKRLKLQDGTHVFDPTARGIALALECIRTVDISQHQIIRPNEPIFIR